MRKIKVVALIASAGAMLAAALRRRNNSSEEIDLWREATSSAPAAESR